MTVSRELPTSDDPLSLPPSLYRSRLAFSARVDYRANGVVEIPGDAGLNERNYQSGVAPFAKRGEFLFQRRGRGSRGISQAPCTTTCAVGCPISSDTSAAPRQSTTEVRTARDSSLYDREGKDMTTNTINSGKIEPPKPSPPCRPRLLPLKENLVIQRANRSARRGLGHEPRLFA